MTSVLDRPYCPQAMSESVFQIACGLTYMKESRVQIRRICGKCECKFELIMHCMPLQGRLSWTLEHIEGRLE
jgi:hypothetical protein